MRGKPHLTPQHQWEYLNPLHFHKEPTKQKKKRRPMWAYGCAELHFHYSSTWSLIERRLRRGVLLVHIWGTLSRESCKRGYVTVKIPWQQRKQCMNEWMNERTNAWNNHPRILLSAHHQRKLTEQHIKTVRKSNHSFQSSPSSQCAMSTNNNLLLSSSLQSSLSTFIHTPHASQYSPPIHHLAPYERKANLRKLRHEEKIM